jgi:hypothetical protein
MENKKSLKNPIEEYFTKIETSKESVNSKAIFEAENDNLDLKTELSIQEIVILNKLEMNNLYLKSKGIKPVFSEFIKNYERLKISLDRKSRGEFVNLNKSNNTDDILNGMSNLSNIAGAKK